MKPQSMPPLDPTKLVQVTLNRHELVLINQMCALGVSTLNGDISTAMEMVASLQNWDEWTKVIQPLMLRLVELGVTAWPELEVVG